MLEKVKIMSFRSIFRRKVNPDQYQGYLHLYIQAVWICGGPGHRYIPHCSVWAISFPEPCMSTGWLSDAQFRIWCRCKEIPERSRLRELFLARSVVPDFFFWSLMMIWRRDTIRACDLKYEPSLSSIAVGVCVKVETNFLTSARRREPLRLHNRPLFICLVRAGANYNRSGCHIKWSMRIPAQL